MKKALVVIGSIAVAAVMIAKIIRDRLNRQTEEGHLAAAA